LHRRLIAGNLIGVLLHLPAGSGPIGKEAGTVVRRCGNVVENGTGARAGKGGIITVIKEVIAAAARGAVVGKGVRSLRG
jgi:hypothetical protein